MLNNTLMPSKSFKLVVVKETSELHGESEPMLQLDTSSIQMVASLMTLAPLKHSWLNLLEIGKQSFLIKFYFQ